MGFILFSFFGVLWVFIIIIIIILFYFCLFVSFMIYNICSAKIKQF